MLRNSVVWLKSPLLRVSSNAVATTKTDAAAVITVSSTRLFRYQGGLGGTTGVSFQYRAHPGSRSSVNHAPRSSYGRASRSVIAVDTKRHSPKSGLV